MMNNIERIEDAYYTELENTCLMKCGGFGCGNSLQEMLECLQPETIKQANEACAAWNEMTHLEMVRCDDFQWIIEMVHSLMYDATVPYKQEVIDEIELLNNKGE